MVIKPKPRISGLKNFVIKTVNYSVLSLENNLPQLNLNSSKMLLNTTNWKIYDN